MNLWVVPSLQEVSNLHFEIMPSVKGENGTGGKQTHYRGYKNVGITRIHHNIVITNSYLGANYSRLAYDNTFQWFGAKCINRVLWELAFQILDQIVEIR